MIPRGGCTARLRRSHSLGLSGCVPRSGMPKPMPLMVSWMLEVGEDRRQLKSAGLSAHCVNVCRLDSAGPDITIMTFCGWRTTLYVVEQQTVAWTVQWLASSSILCYPWWGRLGSERHFKRLPNNVISFPCPLSLPDLLLHVPQPLLPINQALPLPQNTNLIPAFQNCRGTLPQL